VVGVEELSVGELAALGVRAEPTLPVGEWFVRPDALLAEAARLQRETPVTGPFTPLHVTDPERATVAATVSVRFTDLAAVVVCDAGEGRVVVTGIPPERMLGADEPGRLLARLGRRGGTGVGRTSVGVGIVGYGPFGGMG